MKSRDCETIRDRIPEFSAGVVTPEEGGMIEAHLVSCADCQEDLEVIMAVRGARPEVPSDLEARIQARIRKEMTRERSAGSGEDSRQTNPAIPIFGRRRFAPAWALSAAAVVILALGTGVIWNRQAPDLFQDPIVVASQEPLPEAWLWDDGMVAGAPVFDGLSDEELEALLKEFEG
ncbi:MAG: zf-HC2 domain-containing protein [Gemmatimonadota bacterium]